MKNILIKFYMHAEERTINFNFITIINSLAHIHPVAEHVHN
jgi:hypothetical protein